MLHVQAQKEKGLVYTLRGDSWMEGHVGKDGKVHPSAVETYVSVLAILEINVFTCESHFADVSI